MSVRSSFRNWGQYGADDEQGGFTLLELLIVLTLMGLLTAMLSGGLRFGARAWQAATDHADQTAAIEAVQAFLRQSLAEARPPDPVMPTVFADPISFDGRPDRLSFIAPLPRFLGEGDQAVDLIAVGMPPNLHVIVRWRPVDQGAAERERLLVEHVGGLHLSYFGTPDKKQQPVWTEVWRGTPYLPRLIRVSISFPPGDRRTWPDLVAGPMRDGATLCATTPSEACLRP